MLHTGAHKINNTLGQGLLAKYMGKERLIAETGAGQHGIATAVVGSLLRFPTEVYMGSEDVERQKLNVFRMELSGAKVIPVETGSRTLKDAINEALRDWISNVDTTHYLIGSSMGPHPYPTMVKHFQTVIGKEAKEDILEKEGKLPDAVIACVGGGSNAMGIFSEFIDDGEVELIGAEGGGEGLNGKHWSNSHCRVLKEFYTVHYHLFFKMMMDKYQKRIQYLQGLIILELDLNIPILRSQDVQNMFQLQMMKHLEVLNFFLNMKEFYLRLKVLMPLDALKSTLQRIKEKL